MKSIHFSGPLVHLNHPSPHSAKLNFTFHFWTNLLFGRLVGGAGVDATATLPQINAVPDTIILSHYAHVYFLAAQCSWHVWRCSARNGQALERHTVI